MPTEHVASPTSPTASLHSTASSNKDFHSHSRSISVAEIAHRSNRFSLSFPVQPDIRLPSPTRSAASPTKTDPPVQPEALASPTGPTDTSFLTALAAQERKVLELKEELHKAEADLQNLKKQWATHEAHKKRNDARKVTKLQPLNTSLPSADKEEDTDGSSAWMQQEMERRKALLNGSRPSSRTVFSGSRHARALSLLSPQRSNMSPVSRHPPRLDSLIPERKSEEQQQPPLPLRPTYISRASTTPDLTTQVVDNAEPEIDLTDKGIDREVLLNTGKKMASDFKDGLWTFIEDLRQATVGDEATQAPQPRRQNSVQSQRTARKQASRASLRPSSKGSSVSRTSVETKRIPPRSPAKPRASSPTGAQLVEEPVQLDIGNSFWKENGLSEPSATPAPVKKSPKHAKSPSKVSVADSDAGWDTWDSPQPERSDSSASSIISQSNTVPNSAADSSARTSVSLSRETSAETPKKDPIPWPALSKFGPANLRRTASHLMNEWERSLTPSPGKELNAQADYLGFAAEAIASTPPKTVQ